jgi:SAM-dependent methyltransferase
VTRAVLLFAREPSAVTGYGRRLGRLRWKRWLGEASEHTADERTSAAAAFAGASVGVFVGEETAIPEPVSQILELARGRVLPALGVRMEDLAPMHTLRELQQAGLPPAGQTAAASPQLAVLFDPAAMPPAPAESLAAYAARIRDEAASRTADPGFRALVFEEPSDHPRPELVELLPLDARNLCDVGCSAGAAGAAWKDRVPSGRVTGIESDSRAAAIARRRLDRVVAADALEGLEALRQEGVVFDAFLFADILEHLEDPIRALSLARRLARPGARLVASVPNVGHLSLVRDLVLGRFDPVPAGLADVGHLRWFSRTFLCEAFEEAGWDVEEVRGHTGGPAPEADEFLASLSDWQNLDHQSLRTYQWIVVARPAEENTANAVARRGRRGDSRLEEGEIDQLVYALDSPTWHLVRFGEINHFSGMVLDSSGRLVRSVRVSIDGIRSGDFPIDSPSSELARHLPHLEAARNCRFEFDLHIGRTANLIEFGAVWEDGKFEPLFAFNLLEVRQSAGKLEAMRLALDRLPTPPPDIVFLTQGHRDTDGYRNSIISGAVKAQRYLAEAGVPSGQVASLLDFGCGSGRMLTGWFLDDPDKVLVGCDPDARLIDWARDHLPAGIHVDRTAPTPPLPYTSSQFDLVAAISVFTHLGFQTQELWVRELERILRPGGVILLTLHGKPYVRLFAPERFDDFEKVGHLEIEGAAEGATGFASFHTPAAVQRLFRGFEVLGYFPSGRIAGERTLFPLAALQDVYVLRKGRSTGSVP